MSRIATAALSLALLIPVGCASIIDGTTQEVSFNSEPSGAQVLVAGAPRGSTPLSIEIDRAEGTAVTIQKDGYEPHYLTMSTKLNSMFWGNILTGGTFGSTTDSMTGASVEYAPNHYFVTLVPIDEPEAVAAVPDQDGELRDFILVNFQNIQDDLEDGQGEYLSSLLSLLAPAEGGPEESIEKLRSLLRANEGDIPGFADAVIADFGSTETTPGRSQADRLLELKELLDDGIINQEEYDRTRQQVLDGL